MSLVLKSNKELLNELNRRKTKFSSYRISEGVVDLNLSSYTVSVNNEEVSNEEVSNEEVSNEEVKKKEPVIVEDKTKVIDFQEATDDNTSQSTGSTRKYNKTMKGGYFGRRRAR